MLDLADTGTDPEAIRHSELRRLPVRHGVVSDVRTAGGTRVNQHAYLAHFHLVGGRPVDYPHMIEHEGHLHISFSGAKQTVEVLRVPLTAIDEGIAEMPER